MNRVSFCAMLIAVAVVLVGASVSYGGTLYYWDTGDGTAYGWDYTSGNDSFWCPTNNSSNGFGPWVDGSDAYFFVAQNSAQQYSSYEVDTSTQINSVNSITFGQYTGSPPSYPTVNCATTLSGGYGITMTGPNMTVISGCSGTIQDVLSGSAGLTKLGPGPLYLQAANTYFGATTISQGTLFLSGSLTHSTPINVASGATFDVSGVGGGYHLANARTLSGTGTVNGAMTVDSGGKIYIGSGSSIGTLHTAGNLTLNGQYAWEIGAESDTGAGTNWDQIAMASGNLAGSTPVVGLTFLGSTAPQADAFWSAAHSWEIINNQGAGTDTVSAATITGYGTNGVGALGTFSVSIGGTGNDMMLNWAPAPVPEPATLALLAAGLLGMIAYAWRKRK